MTAMKRTLLAVLVATGACATGGTTFIATWMNPARPPVTLDGQTTVALVISADDATRRAAEDALAAAITARGVQGVAAWTVLPTDAVRDEARARAAIGGTGARAVVIMEVLAETAADAGDTGLRAGSTNYQSFWPHYNWAWQVAWSPALSPRTNVWIETLVYTLEPEALVWGGVSRSGDPTDVPALFAEVADAAATQMERNGLITPPPRDR